MAALGGYLVRLCDAEGMGLTSLSDGELLACYLATRDETAFAALLRRHGPMVYRVCRRVLANEHDAEDAFQATFLVLARHAGTVRKRASLASWLHGVAHRVSLEALDASARRRRHERRAGVGSTSDHSPNETDRAELRAVLDEEVSRLSERLRAPLVLCLLEGRTQDDVARELGISSSTCRRDLDRAREVLVARLSRRGLTTSPALLGALAEGAGQVGTLPGLALGALSTRVILLTERVIRMTWWKAWIGTAAAVAACVGIAGVAYCRLPADDPKPKVEARGASATKPDPRVLKALELAANDAQTIKDLFQRAVAYGQVAKAHARAGRADVAKETMRKAIEAEDGEKGEEARTHRDNRLGILSEYQAEIGDAKGAVETAEAVQIPSNRVMALCGVAKALATGGQEKESLKILDGLPAGGDTERSRADVLSALAIAKLRAGDAKGALATIDLIRNRAGYDSKAHALATVAVAKSKAKDSDTAAKLLAAAADAAEAADNKDWARLRVAEALAKIGMLDEARKTLDSIGDAGTRDYAGEFVVAAVAGRGDVKAARELASKINDAYRKGDAEKTIVVALLRAKDLAEAAKAADAIGHDISRCYAWMELAKGQAAGGRKDDARKTLTRAQELADRLENPPQMLHVREAGLVHVAGARAAIGDADAALEWAAKQGDPWVRAMARVRVVDALTPSNEK